MGAPAANGSGDPRLALLRQMLRIRRFEETCARAVQRETRIRGFLHLYIGEEAVAVGVLDAIEERDAVVSTYRDHGHALARGLPMDTVMAEMFGKATGVQRRPRRLDAPVRRRAPVLRRQRHRRRRPARGCRDWPWPTGCSTATRVTVCFFGDGAVAEGEFHECLNLAALWQLPVLFCCENNLYAMGTAVQRALAVTDVALRASSYGLVSWAVDGMDVGAVRDATRRAVEGIRAGGGPAFLELRTYRFRAHSMYDPELYRDKAEVERWKERDPIRTLGARLGEEGLMTDDALARMEDEVGAEVATAVEVAQAAPLEPVEDLTRFVTTPAGGP